MSIELMKNQPSEGPLPRMFMSWKYGGSSIWNDSSTIDAAGLAVELEEARRAAVLVLVLLDGRVAVRLRERHREERALHEVLAVVGPHARGDRESVFGRLEDESSS